MNYQDQYADFLKARLNLAKPLKIIFDASNGATGPIIEKVFENSKSSWQIINGKPDGDFPGHGPNPLTEQAIENLGKVTRGAQADCALAFDADGDRLFVFDNEGELLTADESAILMANNFTGAVVLDGSMGLKIRDYLFKNHQKVIDSKTGHLYVKKSMRLQRAKFGIEGSGHYYFEEFFYADSGILAAIYFLNQISKMNNSIGLARKEMLRTYRRPEKNFRVENKMAALESVKEYYRPFASSFSELDGIRFEFEINGQRSWFGLRTSNTEDLVRLNIESENEAWLKEHEAKISELIN